MRLAMPIRGVVQRLAYVLLIALGLGLLVVGRVDPTIPERLRTGAADLVVPVMEAMTQPIAATNRAIEGVRHVVFIFGENRRLREENARLLHWQEVARRLESDNAAMRQLLRAAPEMPFSFVSARVVGDPGGPFVRTVLLNAGERDGVAKAQAVVADLGLIGRVAETGQRASRVLLLTDLNSRVPVVAGRSRHRGVLAGDNSAMPNLEYLPGGIGLEPGDQVVTSGDGGVFPPGLPVGVIHEVRENAIRVRPLVDLGRLEFVRILRYDQPRLPGDVQRTGRGNRP